MKNVFCVPQEADKSVMYYIKVESSMYTRTLFAEGSFHILLENFVYKVRKIGGKDKRSYGVHFKCPCPVKGWVNKKSTYSSQNFFCILITPPTINRTSPVIKLSICNVKSCMSLKAVHVIYLCLLFQSGYIASLLLHPFSCQIFVALPLAWKCQNIVWILFIAQLALITWTHTVRDVSVFVKFLKRK